MVASTIPSAAICLPVESITLPAPPRTVYDEAGDGATAVSIVVMATKAVGAMRNLRFQIKIATENRGVIP